MMKKDVMWVAISLMMAIGTAGCSLDNGTENEPELTVCPVETISGEKPGTVDENAPNIIHPIQLTRAEEQLVRGNNDFAFQLFARSIINYGFTGEGGCIPPAGWDISDPYRNKLLSPLSITFALGMLNNGAVGETRAQICQVLGFGETGADGINDFCRKMLTEAPELDRLTKVAIANTIYMNQGYQLLPDFQTKAAQYYDAEPQTRDFHDGQTLDVINQWASDHTEKMIEKVLDQQSFDPSAISYLLNAVYFKGTWSNQFDEAETRNEIFERAGYDQFLLELPMMHKEENLYYGENDRCQMLQLPYGNGAYQMTLLLPAKGVRIYDIVSTMTADTWQRDYLWQMRPAIVDVKIPRFESETTINLNDILSFLGMPKAFSPVEAEFPGFCNSVNPPFIENIFQKTRIKVNETGTEAAAVTGGMVTLTGFTPEPQHAEFHANRPFLYIISERSSDAIFFIGQFTGVI